MVCMGVVGVSVVCVGMLGVSVVCVGVLGVSVVCVGMLGVSVVCVCLWARVCIGYELIYSLSLSLSSPGLHS